MPIVARTGGLADTVIDANEAALSAGVATGFQFDAESGDALLNAVKRAIAVLCRSRHLGHDAAPGHEIRCFLGSKRGKICRALSFARCEKDLMR